MYKRITSTLILGSLTLGTVANADCIQATIQAEKTVQERVEPRGWEVFDSHTAGDCRVIEVFYQKDNEKRKAQVVIPSMKVTLNVTNS